MEELNLVFNQYIDEVKKLNISEKRDELINSIKQLIVVFETLASKENIELQYLKNNEILDLNKNVISEDDFIEAAIVYLEVAKNIIGQYLEKNI